MRKFSLIKTAAAVFLFLIIIATAAILIILYTAPNQDQDLSTAPWQEHASELRAGDLVLRLGTVTDSLVIAKVSHSAYSHIGMIIQTQPEILVAHATTSDHDYDHDQASITTLKDFWSRALCRAGMAARIDGLDERKLDGVISRLIAYKGRPFVLAPRDQDHFYCSTMLYDAIRSEDPSFTLKWQNLSYPGFKGEYLFPQSFIGSPRVKRLFAFKNDTK